MGWTVLFDGGCVQMIQIDFRLNLLLAELKSHAWLHIEQPARLKCKGAETVLTPEETLTLAPILSFFNSPVGSLRIERNGHLTVIFKEDYFLEITPHERYEAWQVECSKTGGSSMFVCAPGGEVALFRDLGSPTRGR